MLGNVTAMVVRLSLQLPFLFSFCVFKLPEFLTRSLLLIVSADTMGRKISVYQARA